MTIKEMNDAIQNHCRNCNDESDDLCVGCEIESICESCCGDFIHHPKECEEAYKMLNHEDIVNHPNHYTKDGMECIDEMVLIFGKDVVADFCLCNVWKYRYRALAKNGEEDIAKSHWYMNKYKELTTNE